LRAQVGCAEQKKTTEGKNRGAKKKVFLTKMVVNQDKKGFDAAKC
jgi:hypothetical protein